MALSVGELEATIRLRDELSAQLAGVNAKLKDFGTSAASESGKASTAFSGLGASVKSLAGALGIALSVGGIVAFGKALVRMGDEIVRVSERTGLLIPEVQKLSYIAGQSGNSLNELTGAIGLLQNRISSGDPSTLAALSALHVSLGALQTAGPYQQVELLAEAFGKIENPAQRAKLAMDVFGRSGIAILPTLISKFKELGDEAPIMADEVTKALDDTGDAFSRLWLNVKALSATALMQPILGWKEVFMYFDQPEIGPKALADTFKLAGREATALTMSASELTKAMETLTGPVRANIEGAQKLADGLSGAALRKEVEQLQTAILLMPAGWQKNATMMQAVSDAAADLYQKGAALDPALFQLALRSDALAISLSSDLAPAVQGINVDVGRMSAEFYRSVDAMKAAEKAAQDFYDQMDADQKKMNAISAEVAKAPTGNLGVSRGPEKPTWGGVAGGGLYSQASPEQQAWAKGIYDYWGLMVNAAGQLVPKGTQPMAEGGVITKPTLALLGERGPEAVVPLGGGTAGGVVVQVDARQSYFESAAAMDRLAAKVGEAVMARLRLQGKL